MNDDFKNDDIRDLIIERDGYLEQVKELEQELQRKDNEINDLKSSIADYQEAVGDYQDELKRKDNNWNELKKYLEYEIEEWKDVENEWGKIRTSEDENILDKMKELESGE